MFRPGTSRLSCSLVIVVVLFQGGGLADIESVSRGIEDYQRGLLNSPGGIEINYEVLVKQDPRHRVFAFVDKVSGTFRSLWPRIYVRNHGDLVAGDKLGNPVILKNHIREASHDFSQGTGVARDGLFLAQVCNFRHNFSSKLAFPIVFQSFRIADQFFDPESGNPSDFWLPAAITHFNYTLVGEETLDSVRCVVLERTGRDTIWVAIDFGHVIKRREVTIDDPRMRQVFHAGDIRLVRDGLWFPYTQSYSRNMIDSGTQYELQLRVQEINIGAIKEEQLVVHIPEGVAEIEDHIRGFAAQHRDKDRAFREVASELNSRKVIVAEQVWRRRLILGIITAILAIANAAMFARMRSV